MTERDRLGAKTCESLILSCALKMAKPSFFRSISLYTLRKIIYSIRPLHLIHRQSSCICATCRLTCAITSFALLFRVYFSCNISVANGPVRRLTLASKTIGHHLWIRVIHTSPQLGQGFGWQLSRCACSSIAKIYTPHLGQIVRWFLLHYSKCLGKSPWRIILRHHELEQVTSRSIHPTVWALRSRSNIFFLQKWQMA